MATYVIGDVQGCYDDLCRLLTTINFDPSNDVLWFTGDLVNRGSDSLAVLRMVKNLPNAICVLGNHDLSLLAMAYTKRKLNNHTLDAVLAAPDREELLRWLRALPLIHFDHDSGYCLVHAGILPTWNIDEACQYAHEIETILRGSNFVALLENMYGDYPTRWDSTLKGWERYRFIINVFTRMRFCQKDGSLDLSYKGTLEAAPNQLIPWFNIPSEHGTQTKILFGHWAALNGNTNKPNVIALDTGCVWGRALTAIRLEDEQLFVVSCG